MAHQPDKSLRPPGEAYTIACLGRLGFAATKKQSNIRVAESHKAPREYARGVAQACRQWAIATLVGLGGLLCPQAPAQERDSLARLLANGIDDQRQAVLAMNRLSYLYHKTQAKEGLALGLAALAKAEGMAFLPGKAQALNSIGINYFALNLYDTALHYLERSLVCKKALGDQKGVARTYMNLGVMCMQLNQYARALKYNAKALPEAQALSDSLSMAGLLNNTGVIYGKIGNEAAALDYYRRSLAISEKINAYGFQARTANAIGRQYLKLGNHDLGLRYLAKSTAIAKKDHNALVVANNLQHMARALKDHGANGQAIKHAKQAMAYAMAHNMDYRIAHFHNLLGELFLAVCQYDSAEHYYRKAEALAIPGADVKYGFTLMGLGHMYSEQGRYAKAMPYLRQAMDSMRKYNNHEMALAIHRRMARGYQRLGRSRLATRHWQAALILSDTLQQRKAVKDLDNLTTRLDAEKEMRAMALQQQLGELRYQQRIRQQQQAKNYAFAGVGAALALLLLFAISYRRKQRANRLLASKNALITHQKEEITQQSQALRASHKKLQTLAAFKDGFAHMIAHDLKNPLNTVIGLTQGMGQREQKQINLAGRQMLRLVTNMLAVQQFEEATPDLRKINASVRQLALEATEEVALLAQSKAISLCTERVSDSVVFLDRDMLCRVLVNLLTNAIKYSPPNSQIQMVAECRQGKSQFTVADQGPGIDPTHLPHVFDRYWQNAPTHAGMAKSTGLGLAYCKLAVEAHGGTIAVSSTSGVGTVFTIVLPNALTQAHAAPCPALQDQAPLILPSDRPLIMACAAQLKDMMVYQVGDIMGHLAVLDEHRVQSPWLKAVHDAVQHANASRFAMLIREALSKEGGP